MTETTGETSVAGFASLYTGTVPTAPSSITFTTRHPSTRHFPVLRHHVYSRTWKISFPAVEISLRGVEISDLFST